MRRYKINRAADVTRDLDLIEEHFVQDYQKLGDDQANTMEQATARIGETLASCGHSPPIPIGAPNIRGFSLAFRL